MPDEPKNENYWIMLQTAVNSVMADAVARVRDEDRERVAELRDKVGQKMAAEMIRHHPEPQELIAQMVEAGAIRIDFDVA